jgi:hypothetical protein
MNAETDKVWFACKGGHRFRARRAAWMNCIGLYCIEDARPLVTVGSRNRKIKPTPAWAGVDIFGDPIPANEVAQRISDGDVITASRRRESRR